MSFRGNSGQFYFTQYLATNHSADIYFYNFTTPEFNVNVCQLPFWSLTVYFSWKIYTSKEIKFTDCFLVGLFAAFGFLSKYLL